MKKILFGTSALVGAGLIAGQAVAAEGIKLSVGGFLRSAFLLNFGDNDNHVDGNNDSDAQREVDGVFKDGEIYFNGSTTLDNGITVGVAFQLEAEQNNDQFDEAYTYFKGGFGEFRIGSDDEALTQLCVTPPGATANFGAFSPNQVGASYAGALGLTANGFGSISSNTVCSGLEGDSNKLIYFTPTFFGFKLAVSYSPDITGIGRDSSGTVGHNGLENVGNGDRVQGSSVALAYSYAGDEWGVDWSGGASFTGAVGGSVLTRDRLSDGTLSEASVNADVSGPSYYQTGLVVSFGGLKVGGAFEFVDVNVNNDYNWVAGGGISYTVDAWTVGFQGSHGQYNTIDTAGDDDSGGRPTITTGLDRDVQRYALTGIYNFGPGIDIEGELAYTDTSINERAAIGLAAHRPGGPGDDYDAFEIGIGTAISF